MSRSEVAAAILICVAGLVTGVPPAGAHSDAAVLSLVAVRPTADGAGVTVEVDMLFENDDEPVVEAAIWMNGATTDGVPLMPVRLSESDQPGHYEVTAQLRSVSGEWELWVLSEEPEAALRFDYDPDDPNATDTSTSALSARVERPGLSIPFRWIGVGCGVVAAVAIVIRTLQRRSEETSSAR